MLALFAMALTLPGTQVPRSPWAVVALVFVMLLSSTWADDWRVPFITWLIYAKLALIAVLCVAFAGARTVAYGITLGGTAVVLTSVWAAAKGLPGAEIPPGTDGILAGVGDQSATSSPTPSSCPCALRSQSSPPRPGAGSLGRSAQPRSSWACTWLNQGRGSSRPSCWWPPPSPSSSSPVRRRALTRRGRLLPRRECGGARAGGGCGMASARDIPRADSATFSGRTDLWDAVLFAVRDDWFLGQGWGTVWPHPWAQAR